MYLCPSCQYSVQDFELRCPSCELDVKPFAEFNEIPDRLYNEAMQAVSQNDFVSASMKCNAALLQRSSDKGLWLLQGVIYARMEAFQAARQCFQTVVHFDRDNEAAPLLLQRVETLIAEKPSS